MRWGALVAAVLVIAALVAMSATPSGAAGPLPPLSAPRVRSLPPRVLALAPRIINLAPRRSQSGGNTNYTVGTDVLFAFGSAALSSEAHAVLAHVVQHLDSAHAGTVTITGYTDSIGPTDYNLALSQRRARSVEAYLSTNVNNPGLHYHAQGKGEADPVAPNMLSGRDNPDGRRENRRVVITIA